MGRGDRRRNRNKEKSRRASNAPETPKEAEVQKAGEQPKPEPGVPTTDEALAIIVGILYHPTVRKFLSSPAVRETLAKLLPGPGQKNSE
jgi:hypothetical protein